MTEPSYITIAHADSPAEADLLRMRLAAGGVAAVVRDDHLVRLNPILAGVVGGIRVDVPAEQAAIARDVLSDNGLAAHTEDETNAPVPTVACRHCGALGHARSSRSFVAKLSAALLSTLSLAGGVPRAVSDPARCGECGKET